MTKSEPVLHKKDIVYHARILPELGIYDLNELRIRTVFEDSFVGTDKHSKKAFIFPNSAIGKTIFKDRKEALDIVKAAESNKIDIEPKEKYYEEY